LNGASAAKKKNIKTLTPFGNMELVPRMRGKNSPKTILEYSAMTNLLWTIKKPFNYN
jgi:hypothetical protein